MSTTEGNIQTKFHILFNGMKLTQRELRLWLFSATFQYNKISVIKWTIHESPVKTLYIVTDHKKLSRIHRTTLYNGIMHRLLK